MSPVRVSEQSVRKLIQESANIMISHPEPRHVKGTPTPTDEMESDNEKEMSPVRVSEQPVRKLIQESANIMISDPEPLHVKGTPTPTDEMVTDNEKEMSPVRVSEQPVRKLIQESANIMISDPEPLHVKGTPTPTDEMETDNEKEMSPVRVSEQPVRKLIQESANIMISDPEPLHVKGTPTPTDEMESDNEKEMSPVRVSEQSVRKLIQESANIMISDPEPLHVKGTPTPTDEMETDNEKEMSPVRVSEQSVRKLIQESANIMISDPEPLHVKGTPTPTDEMETDNEKEMSPVRVSEQSVRKLIQESANIMISDPEPLHVKGTPTPTDEMETDNEKEMSPVRVSEQPVRKLIQESANIMISDPEPLHVKGTPTPTDEMETDNEKEMSPVRVSEQPVRKLIQESANIMISDPEPLHVKGTPTDEMESDNEKEMSPVRVSEQPVRKLIQESANIMISDPEPLHVKGTPTPTDEIESDNEKEMSPVRVSEQPVRKLIQESANIMISDPEPLHVKGTPTDEMETDNELEMSPVRVSEQPVRKLIQESANIMISDPEPLHVKGTPTPTDEMESDNEKEMSPVRVSEQSVRKLIQESANIMISDPEPLHVKGTPTPTDEMESDNGDEIVDDSASESNRSDIFPMLCSRNIQIPDEFEGEFEDFDDDVLDPDYLPEEDSEGNNSDFGNPRDDFGFQSDHLSAELIQSSNVTSSSGQVDDNTVMTVEKRSSSLAKGERDFKRKHTCFACDSKVCDIPRHASKAHMDDELVKAALSKPKGSKERRALWKVLINKGAFKANMKAKAVGGELQVSKRTGVNRKPDEYQPCIYCYGYFLKKDLWRHSKNCNSSVFKGNEKKKNCIQSNIKAVSATVNSVSCPNADSAVLLERFYEKLKLKDDAYIVVKQDRLLKLYTKSLLEEGKSHTDTSWTVRLLGKLLLKARVISSNTNLTWMELIDNVNWKILAAGIRSLAEFKYEQENVTVGRANIGIKCGQGVRGLIGAFEGYALSGDDDFLLQKARKMLMNYEKEWPKIQNRCREANKVEREEQEDDLLPLTDDIAKLKKYCVGQIHTVSLEVQRECDHQNYKQLQTLVLARLISFNARRGGEPGKLKIAQWQKIYQGKGIHKEEINALPEEEKLLAKRLRLGYVLGKGKKKVPVLFPDETVSAINILLKYRKSVISNHNNLYIFGRLRKNSMSYRRGSDCIRQICNEAELQHSSLITATQLRKYLSTTLQLIDMTEAELRWITDHMGHTIDVHKRWYRLSNKTVELSKVASILVAAETGRLQKACSVTFDDVGSLSHATASNDETKKEELKDVLRDDITFKQIVENCSKESSASGKIEPTPSKKAKTDDQNVTPQPKKLMGNPNTDGKRKDAQKGRVKKSKAQPKVNLEKAAEAQRLFELGDKTDTTENVPLVLDAETVPTAAHTEPVPPTEPEMVHHTLYTETVPPLEPEKVHPIPYTEMMPTAAHTEPVPPKEPEMVHHITHTETVPTPLGANEQIPRENVSCSASVGKALNVLNPQPEHCQLNLHSPSLEQRVIWLESQLGLAWQSIYELQRTVSWLSQPGNQLQNPHTLNQNFPGSNGCVEENQLDVCAGDQISPKENSPGQFGSTNDQVYNNYTKDQLWSYVENAEEFGKASKLLFRKLFSEEEYRGRSLTGSAANKSTAARPALQDQQKLKVIHEKEMSPVRVSEQPVRKLIQESANIMISHSEILHVKGTPTPTDEMESDNEKEMSSVRVSEQPVRKLIQESANIMILDPEPLHVKGTPTPTDEMESDNGSNADLPFVNDNLHALTTPRMSSTSGGKKKKQLHKPWCREEKTALFDAFSSYLVPDCRRLPGKSEIMKVQGNCKALGNRTWLNIKYQLKNMQCK